MKVRISASRTPRRLPYCALLRALWRVNARALADDRPKSAAAVLKCHLRPWEWIRAPDQVGECCSSDIRGSEAPQEGSAVGREAHLHEGVRERSWTMETRPQTGPAIVPASKARGTSVKVWLVESYSDCKSG